MTPYPDFPTLKSKHIFDLKIISYTIVYSSEIYFDSNLRRQSGWRSYPWLYLVITRKPEYLSFTELLKKLGNTLMQK